MIPVVELGQDNKDKTIYKVTIQYEYQGETYSDTSSLYYYSLDKTAPLPSPPMVKQDMSSNYYHMHNYNHFNIMINVALESTFITVKSSLPKINGVTPLYSTTFPFL
ncbi:MAG: phage minor capsid protein, partial [Candidatus Fonsibacter sp.]